MISLNKIQVMGYVGSDPELKYTNNSHPVMKLRVAQTTRWTTNEGQEAERTTWFTCILWGKRAEALVKFVRRGMPVYIEGQIQTREWSDNDGAKHYAWEVRVDDIQILQPKAKESHGQPASDPAGEFGGGEGMGHGGDDIPF